MSKISKILARVLRGTSDAGISFDDLCNLLRYLGFAERIRGSHHIFTREGIPEILNLQPRGSQAKPNQVRQVRGIIVAHRLGGTAEEGAPEQGSPAEESGQATSEEKENGQ